MDFDDHLPPRGRRASRRVTRRKRTATAPLLVAALTAALACQPSDAPDAAEQEPGTEERRITGAGEDSATPPRPAAPAEEEPAADSAAGVPPPEGAPAEAFQACKDSVAVQLAEPGAATWGKAPDNVEQTAPGQFALVAQVRPDSLSPGISFLCVVQSRGADWRVTQIEMQAPPGAGAAPGGQPAAE